MGFVRLSLRGFSVTVPALLFLLPNPKVSAQTTSLQTTEESRRNNSHHKSQNDNHHDENRHEATASAQEQPPKPQSTEAPSLTVQGCDQIDPAQLGTALIVAGAEGAEWSNFSVQVTCAGASAIDLRLQRAGDPVALNQALFLRPESEPNAPEAQAPKHPPTAAPRPELEDWIAQAVVQTIVENWDIDAQPHKREPATLFGTDSGASHEPGQDFAATPNTTTPQTPTRDPLAPYFLQLRAGLTWLNARNTTRATALSIQVARRCGESFAPFISLGYAAGDNRAPDSEVELRVARMGGGILGWLNLSGRLQVAAELGIHAVRTAINRRRSLADIDDQLAAGWGIAPHIAVITLFRMHKTRAALGVQAGWLAGTPESDPPPILARQSSPLSAPPERVDLQPVDANGPFVGLFLQLGGTPDSP